jgi:hypothetical protein
VDRPALTYHQTKANITDPAPNRQLLSCFVVQIPCLLDFLTSLLVVYLASCLSQHHQPTIFTMSDYLSLSDEDKELSSAFLRTSTAVNNSTSTRNDNGDNDDGTDSDASFAVALKRLEPSRMSKSTPLAPTPKGQLSTDTSDDEVIVCHPRVDTEVLWRLVPAVTI